MHPAQAELADPAFLLLIPPLRAGGKEGVPYFFFCLICQVSTELGALSHLLPPTPKGFMLHKSKMT